MQLGVTDWLRFRVGVEYEQERLGDPAVFYQADDMGSLKLDDVALEGVGKSPDPDFVQDEKWDFAYFTQLKYEFSRNWDLALEGYGTFDRLGNSGTPGEARELFGDHDQHRAGPILYYRYFPNARSLVQSVAEKDNGQDDKELSVTIGSGVLFGLNGNTPDATYKLSIEVDY